MKKKFMIATSLILSIIGGILFGNIKGVNAEDNGYKIRLYTTIEKWSWSNDLIYNISETWNENNHLSKKAYLQGPVNNVTTKVEIPNIREDLNSESATIRLGAYRSTNGNFGTSTTGDSFWKVYYDSNNNHSTTRFNFDEGSTVTLIEEYTISEDFTPSAGTEVYDLTNNDYLSLDINNSTILNKSLEGYATDSVCNEGKCNLKIYSDCAYDSDDVTSNRNMICVLSLNRNEKVTTYNKGNIVLPTFSIGTNLNMSGNAAPRGTFALRFKGINEGEESDTYFNSITNSNGEVDSNYNNYTIGQIINYESNNTGWINRSRDSYESIIGVNNYGAVTLDVVRNTNYSLLSYRDAKNYYENVEVLYIPEGSTIDNPWDGNGFENGTYTFSNGTIGSSTSNREGITQPSYNRSFSGNAKSSRNFDEDIAPIMENSNDYIVNLTYNETINRSVPTGIFYNILPYIALLLLSLFGFIFIKVKKNEKEDNTK